MNSRKRKTPVDEAEPGSENTPGSKTGAPTSNRLHRPPVTSASPLAADTYFQNLYSSEPNFKQLGKQDAAFAPLYVSVQSIIFARNGSDSLPRP